MKQTQERVKMVYATEEDLEHIGEARTLDELVVIAIRILDRMPKPVRWVAGPLTSGIRTPEENRERLHLAILRYKVNGFPTFNYLPLERRARKIIKWEIAKKRDLTQAEEFSLQEHLRDRFYQPIFISGRIGELRILPGAYASLNVHWMREYAKANGIPVRNIPAELVPKG